MDTNVKELITDWHINKAKNEQDPFFRFLCHWICFNAWLAHQSGMNTDRQMLDWLKQQTPTSSDIIASYEAMKLTTDGAQNLSSLVAAGPIGDNKGRSPITMGDINDRDNIIESIYRVRCNLFHGGKRNSNSRDRELVEYVNRILTKWLDDLIAGW